MTEEHSAKLTGWLWIAIPLIAVVAIFSIFAPARNLAVRFFNSLRIPKPQAVSVDISAFSGTNGNRALQQMLGQMMTDKVSVTTNEEDQSVTNAGAASQLAGFSAQLPRTRTDLPKLSVAGAHAMDMSIDRAKLQTIFDEAGRPELSLPTSLDSAIISIKNPRSIRAQYGNCPPPANTIQNQVQGPPPPTAEYTDCLVLTEGPVSVVNLPPGFDMEELVEIGLELSGMSPNQAQHFLKTVDWKSTLGLNMPRFVRSFQIVDVAGVQGALINTLARRGPTYVLIWTRDGLVYSLTGFGNSADAVALANSAK